MKAAIQQEYGRPDEVVAIGEAPMPDVGDEEVLVRVHAAGVNWADCSMTSGRPTIMRAGYGLRGPRQPIRGTDLAGTVERVGENVSGLRGGDRVLGWGPAAFAEYVTTPESQLTLVPQILTFEQAAGLPMAGCVALQALRDVAELTAGDRVLVNGASGGIGSITVQIAKSFGAEVTGVCSTGNMDLVRSIGADHVIDYTVEDFTRGDERYDVIVDMADTHTLADRRRVLAPRGVLIPNSGEGGRTFGSIGRILKAWLVSPFVSQKLRPFLSVTSQADLRVLTDLIDSGDLTPVVDTVYPLRDAGRAIAHAGAGHARGKVVVAPQLDGDGTATDAET